MTNKEAKKILADIASGEDMRSGGGTDGGASTKEI